MTNTAGFTASIPGARYLVSPLFCLFGIFDDLFLYQFHPRNYTGTEKALFEQINKIEYQKWSLVNYKSVLGALGADSESFDNAISYQSNYTTPDFINQDSSPEVGSESLLPNSKNFFIFAMPVCVALFVVFKLIALAFSRCDFKLPSIIEKSSFLTFLFLVLFDRNIEQFAFYLTA